PGAFEIAASATIAMTACAAHTTARSMRNFVRIASPRKAGSPIRDPRSLTPHRAGSGSERNPPHWAPSHRNRVKPLPAVRDGRELQQPTEACGVDSAAHRGLGVHDPVRVRLLRRLAGFILGTIVDRDGLPRLLI